MLLAAALVVAWPLYTQEKRLSARSAAAIVVVVAISAAVYSQIGTPNAESTRGEVPSVEEMVASLAARLRENPDDLAGWKMLGRSYLQLRDFPAAIAAFERAVEMESRNDGQTLVDLGEAVLMQDGATISGRAGDLFESAIAIAPSNPKALFYSGLAAIDRGDAELAASRWEALLATSPPPEIEDVLRQRIAEWRGEPVRQVEREAAEKPGTVVSVNVALGDAAAGAVSSGATVFIIARDPAQPSPPIAAVRRTVGELPAAVPLSDADAMIPGRVPSAFGELEIVARVSMSGQPVAQSGDWFGQQVVAPAASDSVEIVIDQQVP